MVATDRRMPYAAGLFYLGYAEGLRREVTKLIDAGAAVGQKIKAKGIVVPHAGYEYSGPEAGAVYGRIEPAKKYIIIGPNHSGFGLPVSLDNSEAWKTPLGDATVDRDLVEDIVAAAPESQISRDAHRLEHSIEVQLPFLQVLTNNDFSFAPITMQGLADAGEYRRVGLALADVVEESQEEIIIVASTDFTHYEPRDYAAKMDKLAIDAILALDPDRLLSTVYENDITMCGYGPVATMLYAVNKLGASKAELMKYGSSADFSRDESSVVGYGGMVIR